MNINKPKINNDNIIKADKKENSDKVNKMPRLRKETNIPNSKINRFVLEKKL